MTVASSRLERQSETRQRLLAAAREAMAQNGWRDPQITFIAARADVATGTVYRYVDSKADPTPGWCL